jgi:anti-sigma factor RsiW
MSADEMTCRELVELVTEYLDGALSAPDLRRFEDHLADCPGCRTYLQQMQQTVRTLGQLSEETIQPQVRDELLQRFRRWNGSS